jgi:hypothetical protein
MPTLAEMQAKPNGFVDPSDDDIVDVVNRQFATWTDESIGIRNQWRMNALMARGFQWAVLNTVTQKVLMPPPPPSRRHITINMLKPYLLDTEAKLHIATPTFDVTPDTLSSEDKDAAIAGESLGQHYWRFLEIEDRYAREIVRPCMHFGNCYASLDWDETIGPMFSQQDEDGSEAIETEGDIRLDIWPPWQFFCDELPGPLDRKSFLCFHSWMTLDEINRRWEEGVNVEPEAITQPMNDVSFLLKQVLGHGRLGTEYSPESQGATVFKWIMKPQKSCPEGFIAYIANGVVLEKGKWPDAFNKVVGYPVVDFHWYRHPGQFRGTAPLEDQIPIQREINKTASQIRENMDTMLALKWMNPVGSGVESIDDLAGQIVDYMPGFEPHVAQPGSLPVHVFRYLSELFGMLEDLQMLHKPSKGQVPAGVKSGVGIELLQEQDDRPLSIPEKGLHVQLTKLFRKTLQIVSVAVEEGRMIEYAGPNRRRQVRTFKGADLRNNSDIHLSVVGGSTKSKPAIVRKVLDMANMGLFKDERGQVDTNRIMEMLRHAIPDVLYEQTDQHETLARDENDALWEGRATPAPQRWERHDIHLDTIEEDMNSMKWKERALKEPKWAQNWINHAEGHIQLFAASMGRPQDSAEQSGDSQAA